MRWSSWSGCEEVWPVLIISEKALCFSECALQAGQAGNDVAALQKFRERQAALVDLPLAVKEVYEPNV